MRKDWDTQGVTGDTTCKRQRREMKPDISSGLKNEIQKCSYFYRTDDMKAFETPTWELLVILSYSRLYFFFSWEREETRWVGGFINVL